MTALMPVTLLPTSPLREAPVDDAEVAAAAFLARYQGRTLDAYRYDLRALEVQARLAARRHHRALSLVDGLVAAVAEARHLVVLHYDSDFELVAKLTGQQHAWVVPRGTAD